MKGNLYSLKECLWEAHPRAPWGDITRVAGLLGPAKESGFRINAHKVEPLLTREERSFA
jgi:hypothetical protein